MREKKSSLATPLQYMNHHSGLHAAKTSNSAQESAAPRMGDMASPTLPS
jgi:hypothetical protein